MVIDNFTDQRLIPDRSTLDVRNGPRITTERSPVNSLDSLSNPRGLLHRLPRQLQVIFLCLLFSSGLLIGTVQAQQPPIIAAASSLQFALNDLAEAFKQDSGLEIRLTFGSSGNLSRQIKQGAPYELFLSADESFPLDLFTNGFSKNAGDIFAIGQLAFITPVSSIIAGSEFLDGELPMNGINRFSVANPEHAPYGKAAINVLQGLKYTDALMEKMVYGENVAQAAQFVVSANADAGLVSLSLTRAPHLNDRLHVTTVPGELHPPIVKRMVLLKHASETAIKFKEYVLSRQGIQLLTEHGFLPDESNQ